MRLKIPHKQRIQSYKFPIYPDKKTKQILEGQLELCRWVYNRLLQELEKANKEGKKLTPKDTQALIVSIKKKEKPELKKVNSKALQMVNYQLWSNIRVLARLKKKGNKIGRLRFKGKGWYKTINFNQSGFEISKKKIWLSKVGYINSKIYRNVEGQIKGVILKKEQSGKWFAVVQAETPNKELPKTGKNVGIDLGISHFAVDSSGNQFENPKLIKRMLTKIKQAQKELSRKKKASKNREKAKRKMAILHEKVEYQRNDYLHKLSRFYINNYDLITTEDLEVKKLSQKGKWKTLHRNILDAAWSKFNQMLAYKAENAGRTIMKVPARGTTQNCSKCGNRVEKQLKDRIHDCKFCGFIADRDYMKQEAPGLC
jgi:putative transposase